MKCTLKPFFSNYDSFNFAGWVIFGLKKLGNAFKMMLLNAERYQQFPLFFSPALGFRHP